jgi:hypothetical protein
MATVRMPIDTSQSAIRSMSPVKAWNVCTGSSHRSEGTTTTWNHAPMSMPATLSWMTGSPAGLMGRFDMITS